jgi:hypothetical protein
MDLITRLQEHETLENHLGVCDIDGTTSVRSTLLDGQALLGESKLVQDG